MSLGPSIGWALVLAIGVSPSVSRAGDLDRNAWGVLAAPTLYTLNDGYLYEQDGHSLDWGAYYSRFLGPKWSVRAEARLARRNSWSTPGQRVVDEDIIEIPLIVQSDRRVQFGDQELRISLGGGVLYSLVTEQTLETEDATPEQTDFGYQKLGWLIDGGVTVGVTPESGIFARFRYQMDETTFAEKDGVEVLAEYQAYGVYVGLEFEF